MAKSIYILALPDSVISYLSLCVEVFCCIVYILYFSMTLYVLQPAVMRWVVGLLMCCWKCLTDHELLNYSFYTYTYVCLSPRLSVCLSVNVGCLVKNISRITNCTPTAAQSVAIGLAFMHKPMLDVWGCAFTGIQEPSSGGREGQCSEAEDYFAICKPDIRLAAAEPAAMALSCCTDLPPPAYCLSVSLFVYIVCLLVFL